MSPPAIEGWHRWGSWSAHFFVAGEQVCKTQHTYAEGGIARGLAPRLPDPAELTLFGVPFGRVCTRCLKLAATSSRAAVE